jgi:hypothetical protein
MYEEVLYSRQVPEHVAKHITEHGGRVKTERVNPAWIFHKIILLYTHYRYIGGVIGVSPIYRYTLQDGAQLLVQFHNQEGQVPGHPDSYWTTLYIYHEDGGANGTEHGTAQTR